MLAVQSLGGHVLRKTNETNIINNTTQLSNAMHATRRRDRLIIDDREAEQKHKCCAAENPHSNYKFHVFNQASFESFEATLEATLESLESLEAQAFEANAMVVFEFGSHNNWRSHTRSVGVAARVYANWRRLLMNHNSWRRHWLLKRAIRLLILLLILQLLLLLLLHHHRLLLLLQRLLLSGDQCSLLLLLRQQHLLLLLKSQQLLLLLLILILIGILWIHRCDRVERKTEKL